MKFAGLMILLMLFAYTGSAQEIPVVREPSSEFLIQRLEIRPSLTDLAPEIPNTGRFRIRTVNFDTSTERREVNIAAVMEQEERMKRRTIELAPPVQLPRLSNSVSTSRGELSVTPRFFNQSFSPEAYTRGTRNSVYRNAADVTGASYYDFYNYNPFRTRGYRAGYGYYYY